MNDWFDVLKDIDHHALSTTLKIVMKKEIAEKNDKKDSTF